MSKPTGAPAARQAALRLAPIALGAAVLAACVALAPRHLEHLDGANFALALERFDLATYRPHFPGYPLYVAAARLAATAGLPAPLALAVPSALGAGLLVVAVFWCLVRLGASRGAALGGAALVASSPLVLHAGSGQTADALALGLFAASLAVLLRGGTRALVLGGALAGLSLGARPSALPLVVGAMLWLVVERTPRRALAVHAGGVVGGVVAWLLPLVVLAGPSELVRLGAEHVTGHFTSWGGTALSTDAGGAHRLASGARALWLAGLGGAGPGALSPERIALSIALVFGLGAALRRARTGHRAIRFALAVSAPYLAWILVAQNLERPRHVLPLAVVLLAMAGAGAVTGARAWLGGWRRGVPAAAAAGLALAVSAPLLHARAHANAPTLAVVALLAPRAERTLLYSGEAVRLAQVYAPWLRARRPGDLATARADARSEHVGAGVEVYVTSDVDGATAAARAGELVEVARFSRDPVLDPIDSTIILYRVRAPKAFGAPALAVRS